MGEALTGKAEALSPALRKPRGMLLDPNGREINYGPPAGAVVDGAQYTPDETIYEIDRSHSPIVQFAEAAKAGKVTVEAHLLCEVVRGDDEDNERNHFTVRLDAAQVREAVSAGHEETWLGEALCRVQQAAFGQLRENLRGESGVSRLREDFGDWNDPAYPQGGTGMSPASPDEVLPLGNGPFNQQQYLYDRWDSLAKQWWAGTHDPVADGALEIIINFVVGRGFTVTCKDPLAQAEWDAFWKFNHGPSRIHMWLRDWFRDGDNFTEFYPQVTGPAKIKMQEPSTILDYVTEPTNIDKIAYFWQQYASQYQLFATGDIPTSRYVIRQIDPKYMIHTKINASSWEKFGRGDLFPVLGWLKRLRDYFSAETMKAIVQAAFAWDIMIKGSGADTAAVSAYASQQPPPNLLQQGQGFYHNDAVEIKALQSDKAATSSGSIGIGDGILGIIAIGLHIAKDYLGVTSRGARATAVVAETPAVKHFEARQSIVRHWIESMAEKAFEIAIAEGRLPRKVWRPANKEMVKECIKTLRSGDMMGALRIMRDIINGGKEVPIDLGVEVAFPDIVKGDRKQTILDAEKAESNGWFSKRRSAQIVAGSFDVQDYDYDDEQAEIKEEGRTIISRAAQQVAKGLPTPDEAGWAPGTVADPDYAAPGGDDEDSSANDNPGGNDAAKIRNENRGDRAKESFARRAVRKTISFIIGEK